MRSCWRPALSLRAVPYRGSAASWSGFAKSKLTNRIGQLFRAAIVGMTMATALSAAASSVQLAAVPSSWRIETYVGATGAGNVVLWYTGSPCTNGELSMSNPSEQDRNRLWTTVLAAKLANRRMFIYYENANAPSNCPISSFGMDDQ